MTTATMPETRTYSVKEVAAMYGRCEETILAMINSKELGAVDVGRGSLKPRWRIKQKHLDEFERRRGNGGPEPKPAKRRGRETRETTGRYEE